MSKVYVVKGLLGSGININQHHVSLTTSSLHIVKPSSQTSGSVHLSPPPPPPPYLKLYGKWK